MIKKICNFLTKKIQESNPEIDDEKAEIINYGLQNLIGEVPKFFILLAIAYLLGIWKLAIITFCIMLPYRVASGGFHLHSHLGCIIGTTLMYCGTAVLSQNINLNPEYIKYILVVFVCIFGLIMIKLYAPADTENVPILSKKERKKKRIQSYILLTINLVLAILIKNNTISNVFIFGTLIQTLTITRLAYNLTKNKYGYELYQKGELL